MRRTRVSFWCGFQGWRLSGAFRPHNRQNVGEKMESGGWIKETNAKYDCSIYGK
jgi:hypothetical protein